MKRCGRLELCPCQPGFRAPAHIATASRCHCRREGESSAMLGLLTHTPAVGPAPVTSFSTRQEMSRRHMQSQIGDLVAGHGKSQAPAAPSSAAIRSSQPALPSTFTTTNQPSSAVSSATPGVMVTSLAVPQTQMVPTAGGTSTILNIYLTDPRQRQHSLSPPAITTAAQKRPRRYNLDQVHHRPPVHQCNQQYSLYTESQIPAAPSTATIRRCNLLTRGQESSQIAGLLTHTPAVGPAPVTSFSTRQRHRQDSSQVGDQL